jgi:hypothetical protein
MIRYKKGHNGSRHLDETKLNKLESEYFIEFLNDEIKRHKKAIIDCCSLRFYNKSIGVLKCSYTSSISGHRDDINATQKTVDYLKKKWGL